jgi:DNA-binding winged helix-turn-helix (wHTH) protein/pimeloyl-ACP methyl ester carboxylesterase
VRYQFEGGMLDAARRELRQGNRLVAVEPQVFDLLEFLIDHRDRVVSRDDLIAGVWDGRIVSESTLATRINAARKAVGDDGTAQRLIKTIARKGFRFVGDVRELSAEEKRAPPHETLKQDISFCRTSDNVGIALASVGVGPPLVKTANWLNHLEADWESPLWSPTLRRLAARFRLIRYDGRGIGLSDRDVGEVSQAGFERDLEAVIEASKLDRFSLLGLSQGVAAAVGFAARHPERVSRLILYGGYAQGRNRRGSQPDEATAKAMLTLMEQGWGHADSAFMRAFSSLYLPDASRAQIQWFADMQRQSASGAMAARLRVACDDIDIMDLLPKVTVPTLVIHARKDNVAPVEQARIMASKIPGACFVTLESENHVPVPDDPTWGQLMEEIEAFAAGAG